MNRQSPFKVYYLLKLLFLCVQHAVIKSSHFSVYWIRYNDMTRKTQVIIIH